MENCVESLVDRYFRSVNEDLKKCYPAVLSQQFEIVSFVYNDIFCVNFSGDADTNRMRLFREHNSCLYPNLFTSSKNYSSNSLMKLSGFMHSVSGFRLEPKKFAFYLQRDSSACLGNLIVVMPRPIHGKSAYVVDLMYLVAYGQRVGPENVLLYLEDLIKNSIEKWRSR